MPRASGIYEGGDRAGPIIVKRDLDLEAFVEQAGAALEDSWEVSGLMYQSPKKCFQPNGSLLRSPARKSS